MRCRIVVCLPCGTYCQTVKNSCILYFSDAFHGWQMSYRKQADWPPRGSEEYSVLYPSLKSINRMLLWLAKAATADTFSSQDHIEESQWGHLQPLKYNDKIIWSSSRLKSTELYQFHWDNWQQLNNAWKRCGSAGSPWESVSRFRRTDQSSLRWHSKYKIWPNSSQFL